jgi:hypothetical protein
MNDGLNRQCWAGLTSGPGDDMQKEPGPPLPAVFTPEVIQVMSEGFDLAWTTLLAADHACAADHLASETRRQLALAIVEAARRGTYDCVQLSESALRSLFPLGLEVRAGRERSRSK